MAMKPRLQSQPREPVIEKDPLAELSRIMGLDSRLRQEAEEDHDFGIDLEQELLGELTAPDLAANDPAPRTQAAHADLSAVDAEMDVAFDGLFDDAVMTESTQQAALATHERDDAAVSDFDFSDFDLSADLDQPDLPEPAVGHADTALLDEAEMSALQDALAEDTDTVEPQAQMAALEPVEIPESFGTNRPGLEDELKALLTGLGPTTQATSSVAPEPDSWATRARNATFPDLTDSADAEADLDITPYRPVDDAAPAQAQEPVVFAPQSVDADRPPEMPVDEPVAYEAAAPVGSFEEHHPTDFATSVDEEAYAVSTETIDGEPAHMAVEPVVADSYADVAAQEDAEALAFAVGARCVALAGPSGVPAAIELALA